jgi:apolipoprotein N-acyltransferase
VKPVNPSAAAPSLSLLKAVPLAFLTAVAFHVAFTYPAWSWLVLAFLGGLFALRRLGTARRAFYAGLAVGLGIYGPQLAFFWRMFGPAAIALWLVAAFWLGAFVLLMHHVQHRWGSRWAVVLVPVVWLGLEFFRSELYYLRFAWFTAGSVLPVGWSRPLLSLFGVYGCGAVLMGIGAMVASVLEGPRRFQQRVFVGCLILGVAGCCLVAGIWLLFLARTRPDSGPRPNIHVAGLQLEFAGESEIIEHLRHLAKEHPEAELVVLSEYAFVWQVPDGVKEWCRKNRRWLIAGGKEPLLKHDFYDTAYVISTNGEVVFQQGKMVPVQMFKDGLPAPEQRVWDSPWGKVGICICYDLNYSRVVDGLIRQGARALIVPTMDVESWGLHEHELAARLTPIRAAEHRVPVFRLASSGISQLVSYDGELLAQTPVPGQGEILAGELSWRGRDATRLPLDRYLAPVCVAATIALILVLLCLHWRDRRAHPSTLNAQRSTSP